MSIAVGAWLVACGGAEPGTDESPKAPAFAPSFADAGGVASLAACATAQQGATLTPLNLVFVYDKSGSMGDRSRVFSCASGEVQCGTLLITTPTTTIPKYVCFPIDSGPALQVDASTNIYLGGAPCPTGMLDGEATVLCANPNGCAQTTFFDPAAKWVPVGQAANAFFADAKSAGIAASLGFFPRAGAGGATACESSAYATPAVAMTALPNANPFSAAIAAEKPMGNTPTQAALLGAVTYATGIASARPNEATAIVLVSDGDPTECSSAYPQPIDVVANVARTAATNAQHPIKTYVIGVGMSLTNLNAIAAAGGTTAATLVTTTDPAKTATDFQNALEKIRGQALSCDVALPLPPGGKTIDVGAVNVVATIGGSDVIVPYAKDCAGGTGWHYDDVAAPKKVQLCNGSCDAVRADAAGKLSITFGCATKGDPVR